MKLTRFIVVGLIVWAAIVFVQRQAGYRVTSAEPYSEHYDGVFCAEQNQGLTCDLPEIHYTLVHKGVKLFTQCQAWDKKNNCGELRVGETYTCRRDDHGSFVNFVSCDHSTLLIQKESATQEQPEQPAATQEQPELPATLEEQGQCARQAREEFKLEGFTMDAFTAFTDHYSPKLGKCFMEVTSSTSTGNVPSIQKHVEDAFEGKVFAQYAWSNEQGKKYWEVAPYLCKVGDTVCKSTDEFDSLVLQKYGTGDSQ